MNIPKNKKYDLVAIGECLIDFTPSEDFNGAPSYIQNPGGAPANVLAMASNLGLRTAFIGKVGMDFFGRYLEEKLISSGIDTSNLVSDQNFPTTVSFVSLNESGEREFLFYRSNGADTMLGFEEVDADLLRNTAIFHFGSVSMTHDISREATVESVKLAKKAGAFISYDPNYRPSLWDNPEEAREVIISAISYSDLIKLSLEELIFLTGKETEEGSSIIHEMGPETVIVTMGGEGSFIRRADYTGYYPAYDVKTVDTTGAGDAFLGAFLSMIIKEGFDRVDDLMNYSNAAGGLATAGYGAIPSMPTNDEIIDCINRKKRVCHGDE